MNLLAQEFLTRYCEIFNLPDASGRKTMTAHLNPEHIRPFNLEHARAGAPYATRGGLDATILKWDGRNADFPLVGTYGKHDEPNNWRSDGRHSTRDSGHENDLVMTPLGFIEGKPFFCGDMIVSTIGTQFKAEPRDKDGDIATWSWPKPARVYPETRMPGHELHDVYVKNNDPTVDQSMVAVANAALRHAIDAGQVVSKEDHEQALITLGERLKDIAISASGTRTYVTEELTLDRYREVVREEWDKHAMAIAAAVRVEFRQALAQHRVNLADLREAVDALDLAAIIAKVQP